MSIQSIICSQCGGTIEFDDRKGTGRCPFCGTQYVLNRDIHNTIINQTTQIVRGKEEIAHFDELQASFDSVLTIRQFELAGKILDKLLLEYPEKYQVWIDYIKFELSQFDQKYEDKTETITAQERREIIKHSNRSNCAERIFCNEIEALSYRHSALKQIREQAQNAIGELQKYKQEDATKLDYSVLDEHILSAINGLLSLLEIGGYDIGEFIICEEKQNNGTGCSYIYLGEKSEIVLPVLEENTKLNRIYIAKDIPNCTIIVPHGITVIENQAFSSCNGLTELIIDSQSICLKKYSISNCKSIKNVFIKGYDVIFGTQCLCDCPNLIKIQFQSSYSLNDDTYIFLNHLIEQKDYIGLNNLKVIYFKGNPIIQRGAFKGNKVITHIVVQNSKVVVKQHEFYLVFEELTEIREFAFSECLNLRCIDLSSSKLSLREGCFSDTVKLEACNIIAEEILIERDVFSNAPRSTVLTIDSKNKILNKGWKRNTKMRVVYK